MATTWCSRVVSIHTYALHEFKCSQIVYFKNSYYYYKLKQKQQQQQKNIYTKSKKKSFVK